MNDLKLVCALLALILLPRLSIGDDEVDKGLGAKLSALLADLKRDDSPGYAIGVIRNGQFLHRGGYGIANLDEQTPISSDSVFEVFSVAKSFTTACVARLLDMGTVKLDDDVRMYVPELPKYKHTIKIRHLIRCQSGLRDYASLMTLLGREFLDHWTDEDVLDAICRQKQPTITPGKSFQYSNTDYFLLGLIIERSTGKTLREFAKQELFVPLEMRSTFFDDRRELPLRNRAVGYHIEKGQYQRAVMSSSTVGPFGLKTSIEDLLKWDTNFPTNKLKKGKHLDEFFARGSLGNENCLSSYPHQKYKGLARVWYSGGGPGFFAQYVRFSDCDLSIVVLANHANGQRWQEMIRIIGDIADVCLADEIEEDDKPATVWKEKLPRVQLEFEHLTSLTGGFRKPLGEYVRLAQNFSGLELIELSQGNDITSTLPLRPLGKFHFRAASAPVPFDLVFNDDGRKSDVRIVYQDGRREKWKPVDLIYPDAKKLKEYVGEFYCADLESVYRFTQQGKWLYVQMNNGPKRRLQPIVQDGFVFARRDWGHVSIQFSRDGGEVTGFKIDFGRAKGLAFQRQDK